MKNEDIMITIMNNKYSLEGGLLESLESNDKLMIFHHNDDNHNANIFNNKDHQFILRDT